MDSAANAIIMVGQPGSGKSTAASQLHAVGWSVCSQDTEGGDRVACERRVWECLSRGERVVIDRTNTTADQRALWISLITAASKHACIAALHCDMPVEECITRVKARTNHPLSGSAAEQAIRRCAEELQLPTDAEGFSFVLKYVSRSSEGEPESTGHSLSIVHGTSLEANEFRAHVEAALAVPNVNDSPSDFSDAVDPSKTTMMQPPSVQALGSVVSKMECVYTTEYRGTESAASPEKGENLASRFVRPEARAMFESGHYVATVKVHGRCCKWNNGRCFRRLDVNLGSPAADAAAAKKLKKKEAALLDAFLAATSEQLGVDLTRCWQAGFARDWSWRDSVAANWGWVATVSAKGWRPTAAPDRHGHWIGYSPVHHQCAISARVLPVEHDADVRHGFDEQRGVAFCLGWPQENDGTGGGGRLELVEVPVSDLVDGSYELIGPNDAHGGPYRRSLPVPADDAEYRREPRFPDWKGDRNERHYFVKHGSVQWRPADQGGNPPPTPLDQDALRAWMKDAHVEGVVWHGTGPFQGRMFKCHVGHLGLAGAKTFAFRRREHVFLTRDSSLASAATASSVLDSSLAGAATGNTPTAQATDSSAGPELSEVVSEPAGPAMGALVRVRVCCGADRRDVRVLVVQRDVTELAKTVRNKWRKVKVGRICVEDGAASQELTPEVMRTLPDGVLLVVY